MKFIILGLIVTLVHFSKEGPAPTDEISALINECVEEASIDSDVAQKFINTQELYNEPQFKCFLKCLAVNTEVINDKDIDFELLKEIMVEAGMSRDKAIAIVRACDDISGTEPCNIAYELAFCLKSYAVEHKYFA